MTELVDARAARAVAGKIRQGIRDYLSTLALVKKAWDEEHWRVLGYESWDEYVGGEFGAERLGLPAEHRDKVLAELRLSGMSVRAIAATTGAPKSTIADGLARLSESGQLEQPDSVRSLDGRTRPASSPTGSDGIDASPPGTRSGQGEGDSLQGASPASPTTTAAEVEDAPSADGTESDSDALRQHASARVTDGESVPVPAAPVEGAGVAGATPDWSDVLADRVSIVHEFMTDYRASELGQAGEADWAELLGLVDEMRRYAALVTAAAYTSREVRR